MFNKGLRKESIGNMMTAQSQYDSQYNGLIQDAVQMLDKRRTLRAVIEEVWEFTNPMLNKPTTLDRELKVMKIETKKFSQLLKTMEAEIKANPDILSTDSGDALALATTLGTTLPEVAGSVDLNLGGEGKISPGSVFLISHTNKRVAEQVDHEIIKIRRYMRAIEGTRMEVEERVAFCKETTGSLIGLLLKCRNSTTNYKELTEEEKLCVNVLVGNARTAAVFLNSKVGINV